MYKYLIVKCVPCDDQYECDAYREPYLMTNNWKKDLPEKGYFDVWEVHDNGALELVEGWDW